MLRYLQAEVVTPAQAVLDRISEARSRWRAASTDAPAIRASLGLRDQGPTILYTPTYSEASSLHLAGEAIVRALAGEGFNVIVKLHDRSLDPDPRYNAGIDWRARFQALAASLAGRVAFTEIADASPVLAAADAMVTDHSSIGFEYLVLDRPLIVFDAPDLPRAARINPEKVQLLRSAADVVRTPAEAARKAREALAAAGHLSAPRRRIARELFYEPGTATARAVDLLRTVLRPGATASRASVLSESGEVS